MMETSWYVSATGSIRWYPFGRIPNNLQSSCLYVSGIFLIVLIAAMWSVIKTDDLFGLTEITNFGLFGGVVQIAVTKKILLDRSMTNLYQASLEWRFSEYFPLMYRYGINTNILYLMFSRREFWSFRIKF